MYRYLLALGALLSITSWGVHTAHASSCSTDAYEGTDFYELFDGDTITAYACPDSSLTDLDIYTIQADFTEDFSITITNNGVEDIDVSISSEYEIIEGGNSYTFEASPLVATEYDLYVNSGRILGETEYEVSVSLSAVSGVDLVVADYEFDAANERIIYTLANRGDTSVDPTTRGNSHQIYIGNQVIKERWAHLMNSAGQNVDFLSAGGTTTLSYYAPSSSYYSSLAYGAYTISIVTDARSNIVESNELNNELVDDLVPPCSYPDLSSSLGDATRLADGDSVTTSACSRESGTAQRDYDYFFLRADSNEDLEVTLMNNSADYLSFLVVNHSGSVVDLAPGDTYTYQDSPSSDGTPYEVQIYPTNRGVMDLEYTISAAITGVSGLDLAVRDIYFDPSTERLHYTLYNRGDTALSTIRGRHSHTIRLNGTVLREHFWRVMDSNGQDVSFLDVQGSTNMTLHLPSYSAYSSLSFSENDIEIMVDANSLSTEVDESNNLGEYNLVTPCFYDIPDADPVLVDGDSVSASACVREGSWDFDDYSMELEAGDTFSVNLHNQGSDPLNFVVYSNSYHSQVSVSPGTTASIVEGSGVSMTDEYFIMVLNDVRGIQEIPYSLSVSIN